MNGARRAVISMGTAGVYGGNVFRKPEVHEDEGGKIEDIMGRTKREKSDF